ncbi:DUF6318 family protein [Arthrobacter sp. UYCo732]|uniref:DUF6318 family protein n=1 Tax=Arthrobacter sp. UYCo732 TaxID=3156336 RepID=UPI0033932F45
MTSHNSLMARRLRLVLAATVAAAALALSGCNTGGEPGGTVTESPSATQTATAGPTPTPTEAPAYVPASASGRAQNVPVPVLPDVAKTETKEGLEAFARYWYDTLTYAYETGDMKPLEGVSGPACPSCARVRDVVEGWHSDGRWLAGGRMVVEGAQTKFLEVAPNEYQVLIQVRQEPLSYFRADKSLDETTESRPAIGDIMIAGYENDAWTAKTVEHLVND